MAHESISHGAETDPETARAIPSRRAPSGELTLVPGADPESDEVILDSNHW